MKHLTLKVLGAVAMIAAVLGSSTSSSAYPKRPIKILVPFVAGSFPDVQVRIVTDKLSKLVEQPLVVENRSGALGVVVCNELVNARPDGYTLGYFVGAMAVAIPAHYDMLGEPMTCDPRELRPIGKIANTQFVLVVRSALMVKSVRELISYTKKDNSGGVRFAVPNPLGLLNIAILESAGARIQKIPYQAGGEPAAWRELVMHLTDGMFSTVHTAKGHIEKGTVQGLAIIDSERSPILTSIPTAKQTGYGDLSKFPLWTGLFAPPNTPDDVVATINAALSKALHDPEIVQKMGNLGARVVTDKSDTFKKEIDHQRADMTAFLRANKILLIAK